MNDCAVMYHYVINKDLWKGSVPISPTDFEQQITLLKQKYDIVLPSELNNITEKPKCLLTFDDATKDQYINAFPILKKLNVKAYFAIMSGPLQDNRIPTVHLVHATLANYTDAEIWSSLQPYVRKIDFKLADQYYHYENSVLRRKIKYALNMALDEQTSRKLLIKKVIDKYGTLIKFINSFYISKDELLEMKEAGMELGVHCVDHLPYKGPAEVFFKKEIVPCMNYLKNELGVIPYYYTPAFGGGINYKQMLIELEPILKANGFKLGFTTIETEFNANDKTFWINRIDCNKVEEILF